MGNDAINLTAIILLIIGGLNWGLVIFDVNLIELLSFTWLINLVYGLIAISAIYKIFTIKE